MSRFSTHHYEMSPVFSDYIANVILYDYSLIINLDWVSCATFLVEYLMWPSLTNTLPPVAPREVEFESPAVVDLQPHGLKVSAE